MYDVEKIEIIKNPKWSKTHAKFKAIYGASFCKMADAFEKGTTTEPLNNNYEELNTPTCMDCRFLMLTQLLFGVPASLALPALKYMRYAHKMEKYHQAKIF